MTAQELKTAATRLRDTATKATPGPWHTVGLPWNHGIPYVIAGHHDPHVGAFIADVDHIGDDPGETERDQAADAAWIALANPALAEPLADLLDAIDWLTEAWAAYRKQDPGHAIVNAANKIAAVINGSEP